MNNNQQQWGLLGNTAFNYSAIDWSLNGNNDNNERSFEVLLVERSEQDESFYSNQESLYTKNMFNDLYNELKNNMDKLELDETNFSSLNYEEKEDLDKKCSEMTKDLDLKLKKFKEEIVKLWNEASETKKQYTQAWDKLNAFNECSLETINTLMELEGENTDKEKTENIQKWFTESQEKLKNHWNVDELKKRYETAICKINHLLPIIQDVSNLTDKPMCPICWKNTVDTFNMSCGHTQCSKCSESIESSKMCPICRQPVLEIKKLYFN